MSRIERFSFESFPHESYMSETPDGEYVLYKKFAELKAQRDALAAENAALKDLVALLLEDARRIMQVEPNAGTESRINHALSLLNRAGKGGE